MKTYFSKRFPSNYIHYLCENLAQSDQDLQAILKKSFTEKLEKVLAKIEKADELHTLNAIKGDFDKCIKQLLEELKEVFREEILKSIGVDESGNITELVRNMPTGYVGNVTSFVKDCIQKKEEALKKIKKKEQLKSILNKTL